MKSKRYVIVDSKRFFAFITFIFVISAIAITLMFQTPKAHSSLYSQIYKEYEILEGDSLWEISIANMPTDYDVRRMVYDIKKLNNMETSYIYQGDTIKIPIYND